MNVQCSVAVTRSIAGVIAHVRSRVDICLSRVYVRLHTKQVGLIASSLPDLLFNLLQNGVECFIGFRELACSCWPKNTFDPALHLTLFYVET